MRCGTRWRGSLAICLECEHPDARVKATRLVRGEGGTLVQMRFVLCPSCGIVGQEIRPTGPSIKRDMVHEKRAPDDPTPS